MNQWIRWWGLGVFVAVVVLLWLISNPLIEWSIESAGSQAVGAKVELDSVDFGFSPVRLQLNRLQVTNPNEPMRNLVAVQRVDMALNGYALMRRQFVAETMAAEGLRFDTQRSESGAMSRWWSASEDSGEQDGGAEQDGFDVRGALPGMDLPDPDRIVKEEREQVLAKVDGFDSEAEQIRKDWNETIERLPDRDRVRGYRERWNELKEKNALSRVTGVRQLKKNIDKDLKTVNSLDDQLSEDRKRLQELVERARNLPASEADRLMSASGLKDGFEGVTRQLMGDQLSRWVQNAIVGYRLLSRYMGGREASEREQAARPRIEGETIRFPEEEPLPGFLVKRAALDGKAVMAGSAVDFSGTIRDMTTDPAVWGKPTMFDLDGKGAEGTTLSVNGQFDHRQQPGRDEAAFTVKQLTLKDASFSSSSKLPITLRQGLANIDGNLAVSGGELDAMVKTRVDEVSFSAGSEDSGSTVERLARAIEGVSSFRLDLGLGGTLSSPKVTLDSDLDRLIGQALKEEVSAELAKVRQQLEERLRTELAPGLKALAGKQQALDQYREQIDQRLAALRDIRP